MIRAVLGKFKLDFGFPTTISSEAPLQGFLPAKRVEMTCVSRYVLAIFGSYSEQVISVGANGRSPLRGTCTRHKRNIFWT
jgi:hypothetical protein